MKYIFLLSFLIMAHAGYACSCMPNGKIDNKQFNSYDLILKGKVMWRTEKEGLSIVYFNVAKYYKGKLRNKIVKITTSSHSASCGVAFGKGEDWLVFANKGKSGYSTSLCSRTKKFAASPATPVDPSLAEDLAFLEKK